MGGGHLCLDTPIRLILYSQLPYPFAAGGKLTEKVSY